MTLPETPSAPRDATIAGFHHVKLPVADPGRSRDWYTRVLGFVTEMDFVEDEGLMGVAMIHPATNTRLAVRRDPARAEALGGFAPIALAVETTRRSAVRGRRCQQRVPRTLVDVWASVEPPPTSNPFRPRAAVG